METKYRVSNLSNLWVGPTDWVKSELMETKNLKLIRQYDQALPIGLNRN